MFSRSGANTGIFCTQSESQLAARALYRLDIAEGQVVGADGKLLQLEPLEKP